PSIHEQTDEGDVFRHTIAGGLQPFTRYADQRDHDLRSISFEPLEKRGLVVRLAAQDGYPLLRRNQLVLLDKRSAVTRKIILSNRRGPENRTPDPFVATFHDFLPNQARAFEDILVDDVIRDSKPSQCAAHDGEPIPAAGFEKRLGR